MLDGDSTEDFSELVLEDDVELVEDDVVIDPVSYCSDGF
jgi:hypothetical protein